MAEPNQNQNQQTQQGAGSAGDPAQQQNQTNQQTGAPAIDYSKIQQMLEGLSQQEVEQAIEAFKQQKAANTPDVGAMRVQVTQAQEAARQAQIQSAAVMAAVDLGIDSKTIPYALKMADLSQAVGQDGKINEEALKAALNKVLEDVPGLKPQAAGAAGFVQVGAASGSAGAGQSQQATQTQQTGVPTKRWNRFN